MGRVYRTRKRGAAAGAGWLKTFRDEREKSAFAGEKMQQILLALRLISRKPIRRNDL